MQDLLPLAEKLGARLKARGDTIAIAESSTGGLISAALLSVGGASAYFRGGSVIYTQYARSGFLEIPNPLPNGMRASSEPYAALLATTVRSRLGSTWGLSETGATGPTGNRYGDAAGHTCIGLEGPNFSRAITLVESTGVFLADEQNFAARRTTFRIELLKFCLFTYELNADYVAKAIDKLDKRTTEIRAEMQGVVEGWKSQLTELTKGAEA
jgi:PncC family amidohydrolase